MYIFIYGQKVRSEIPLIVHIEPYVAILPFCTSIKNLPESRKIWECFAGETQQVQRRCIAKLRADVEVENRWLCT